MVCVWKHRAIAQFYDDNVREKLKTRSTSTDGHLRVLPLHVSRSGSQHDHRLEDGVKEEQTSNM